MQSVSFALVLALLTSQTAWAQPFASPPPGLREQGQLLSLHSGRCLGGGGHPAVEPCGPATELATLPVPGAGGQGGAFLLRHQASGRCLFANRDGRFGFYVCTPAYSDQFWSWLPVPGAAGARMLRAQHSGQCLFSNADGRFGLYTCTVGYSDQHWSFGAARAQPLLARPPAGLGLLGTWYFADGAAIAIHEGGSFVLPDDGGGTWRPLGHRQFELLFSSGRVDRVRLAADGALLEGQSFARGRSWPVSARRQPPPLPQRPPPLPPRVCPPPIPCGVYCPYGMAHDERGCSQCACLPGPGL